MLNSCTVTRRATLYGDFANFLFISVFISDSSTFYFFTVFLMNYGVYRSHSNQKGLFSSASRQLMFVFIFCFRPSFCRCESLTNFQLKEDRRTPKRGLFLFYQVINAMHCTKRMHNTRISLTRSF